MTKSRSQKPGARRIRLKPEIRSRNKREQNLLMRLSALYSGFWLLAPEFCFSFEI
jgi:hypothetical protein